MSTMTMGEGKPFRITGKMVFWSLVAFFGVITVANIIMIWIAVSSFTGIEAKNAYEAGRTFNESVAASQAQNAADWQVKIDFNRSADRISAAIRDPQAAPMSGLNVIVKFRNPVTAQADQMVELSERESGLYSGVTPALTDGQWDLVLEARRGDELVYTSRNRVLLD